MRVCLLATLFAIGSLGFGEAARAQEDMTMEMLLWDCGLPTIDSPVEQMLKYMNCTGYVAGALDTLPLINLYAPGTYCPPDTGIQTQQAVRLVHRYIRAHPEQKAGPARVAIIAAILRAYPCARPEPSRPPLRAAPQVFGR
jgi:hypothetical protein